MCLLLVQLEQLQSIVWPEVHRLVKEEIERIKGEQEQSGTAAGWMVLEAALLLEARWDSPDYVSTHPCPFFHYFMRGHCLSYRMLCYAM